MLLFLKAMQSENLERDQEAFNFWKSWIDENQILTGNKKG